MSEMIMDGVVALKQAKNYANKVGSTISGTSYDYNTGKLTFNTADGDWEVQVNNGMTSTYKNTLDNIFYKNATNELQVNGVTVLTKEDEATQDLDFNSMF